MQVKTARQKREENIAIVVLLISIILANTQFMDISPFLQLVIIKQYSANYPNYPLVWHQGLILLYLSLSLITYLGHISYFICYFLRWWPVS